MRNKFLISGFMLPVLLLPERIYAATPGLSIDFGESANLSSSVDVIVLMTLLSLMPALIISMTCYVQIIIVLSLTRQALGTQTAPPNMVLNGMAIILTLFIMSPVIGEVIESAYTPYVEGDISFTEAIEIGGKPIQSFMVNNSKDSYVEMYAKIAGLDGEFESREDVPFLVASAANITTQITTALGIGAVIMLSFLVIDMVVATILMLLGMFMLPPQMISLPIKIITFLAAGGFGLVIEVVLQGIDI